MDSVAERAFWGTGAPGTGSPRATTGDHKERQSWQYSVPLTLHRPPRPTLPGRLSGAERSAVSLLTYFEHEELNNAHSLAYRFVFFGRPNRLLGML